MSRYDDIINLPHHVSLFHAHMPAADRAAQFSPFAALTGFDGVISETGRLTEERVELDESRRDDLNLRLQLLRERTDEKNPVAITYYVPDARKSGGAYVTSAGTVKKIDDYERCVIMESSEKIPIDEIRHIDGDMFTELY